MHDYAIVGGGIVGAAVALTLSERYPGVDCVLIEKEPDWGRHQTGRNSGVIHSGIYYPAGSLKARLCRAGGDSLVAFCEQHGIAYERPGKVIVATQERELPALDGLVERGRANGLAVRRIGAEEVREIEPNVRCRAGVVVPSAGIVDFTQVCGKYVQLAERNGVEARLGSRVESIRRVTGGYRLRLPHGEVACRYLINCAGLQSDRVALMGGADPGARIIPFRGEYFELTPDRRHLVNHLVYPVPDPDFPFLGVHFTRSITGAVHAGPNAVLAFAREGYRKSDVDLKDLAEVLTYRGFWKLASRHWRTGVGEMVRSVSKQAFVRSLQAMIPEVTAEDLVPSPSGVRAQALRPDGRLVDDFLLVEAPNALHVCNAPSPAATASLAIAQTVVDRVPRPRSRGGVAT
jgi:L-2-hydroxyglutarate oxidase